MPSVKSVSVFREKPWSGGLVKRKYLVTLTDNDGIDYEIISGPYKVLPSDDGSAAGLRELKGKRKLELGPEIKNAVWQDPKKYLVRSLALVMRSRDPFVLRRYLPLWDNMKSRPASGNTSASRAAWLGVKLADYNRMNVRFNALELAVIFLDDDKNHVWNETPAEFN